MECEKQYKSKLNLVHCVWVISSKAFRKQRNERLRCLARCQDTISCWSREHKYALIPSTGIERFTRSDYSVRKFHYPAHCQWCKCHTTCLSFVHKIESCTTRLATKRRVIDHGWSISHIFLSFFGDKIVIKVKTVKCNSRVTWGACLLSFRWNLTKQQARLTHEVQPRPKNSLEEN